MKQKPLQAPSGGTTPLVAFQTYSSTNTLKDNIVLHNNIVLDQGNYNATTGVFTVPTKGIYSFNWGGIGANQTGIFYYYLRKNGVSIDRHYINQSGYGSTGLKNIVVQLEVGDEIDIFYSTTNTGYSLNSGELCPFNGLLLAAL